MNKGMLLGCVAFLPLQVFLPPAQGMSSHVLQEDHPAPALQDDEIHEQPAHHVEVQVVR